MTETDLAFAGVAGQRAALRDGDLTPRDLVEQALARIERLDPQLNAFRRVFFDEALRDADAALAAVRDGDERPLLGIPVAIKDNVDVAGDVTTHGTEAYGAPAQQDCEIVRRVRAAGAIIIGRTNVPPLCAMPSTESQAWGITRNPWDTTRSPGGSSGGSAAAVAAGIVPLALGSDGGGSIRLPAAFCGLFGLKPQRGRVSLAPLPEHWHGMSSLGWLARDVTDAAIALDATFGNVPGDRDTPPAPATSFAEAAATEPGRLRIAWSTSVPAGLRGVVRVDADVRDAVRATAELLEQLGHEVVERAPDYPILLQQMISARVLPGVAEDVATLPRPERLERRFQHYARLGRALSGRVAAARRAEPRIAARMNAIFDDVDVVLTPVAPTAAFDAGRWEGRSTLRALLGSTDAITFTSPWNYTGQPAASVPAGMTSDGLPLAVQLITRRDDETTIFRLAAQLAEARSWTDRRPPVS